MISLCLWKWKAWRIYIIILQEGLLQKQEVVPKSCEIRMLEWALASVLKSVPVYDYV